MNCPNCGAYMRAVLNEDGDTVGYFCDSCRTYDSLRLAPNPDVRHHAKDNLGRHEAWGLLCMYDMSIRVYGDGTSYDRTVREGLEADQHCTMYGPHHIVKVRSVV